ncbi:MAG: TraB/GumN family protein [Leptolyngbya sp. SIO1D8]|nr:TraB/GumN family protein [Leptolyngbya sp. SIO1D8]
MIFLQKLAQTLLIAIGLQIPGNFSDFSQTHQNFLWLIETPTNRVYLLGSIHLLSEEDYPLSQPIQDAFEDAENVVFEIDLGVPEKEVADVLLDRALPDNEDELLQTALDPETYALVEELSVEFDLPLTFFDDFEPWFFSMNLEVARLLDSGLGLSPKYGIDNYLFQQAIDSDKEIIALETFTEQIDILDSLSTEAQQNLIESTIAETQTVTTLFNEIRAAWRIGDSASMEDLLLSDLTSYPELYDVLIIERNQNWLAKIETMLNQTEEDYLIVVGALHMIGDMGLIQQLQVMGYAPEQL